MLKTVLLDFDNTIYDDIGGIRRVFIQLRKEYRFFRQIPLDELVTRFYFTDYGMREMIREEKMPVQEINLHRTDLFLQGVGLPLKDSAVMEIHERIRLLHIMYGKPIQGANRFLKKLREKYTVGIVTNHMGDYQREKIEKSGFEDMIDFMIPAYDYGFFKPEPEIFSIALEMAGSTPEETVMIGDNWKADIIGAIQSGIVPIWANFRNQPPPEPGFTNVIRALSPPGQIIEKIEYFHSLRPPVLKIDQDQ
jgi:putative hydrolase of the HAD superfamily